MSVVEVRVPEMGDAKGVSVVDILVKKGSEIRVDDPLITLETEKASMDVPSPVSGVVDSIELKKGDEASAGSLIATVQLTEAVPAVTIPLMSRVAVRSPRSLPALTCPCRLPSFTVMPLAMLPPALTVPVRLAAPPPPTAT